MLIEFYSDCNIKHPNSGLNNSTIYIKAADTSSPYLLNEGTMNSYIFGILVF